MFSDLVFLAIYYAPQVETIAEGCIEVVDIQSTMNVSMSNFVMFAKAQSGMDETTIARFNETSQNPVLLDALGLWLLYVVPLIERSLLTPPIRLSVCVDTRNAAPMQWHGYVVV